MNGLTPRTDEAEHDATETPWNYWVSAALAQQLERELEECRRMRNIELEMVSKQAFERGWNAGFQEALEPDRHPDQNRCEVAYAEWKAE